MITSHEGEVTKPFENPGTCNNEKVDTTETPRPTKTSNLLYNFSSALVLYKIQLHPHLQGIVGHAPERVTASVSHKGEVGNTP